MVVFVNVNLTGQAPVNVGPRDADGKNDGDHKLSQMDNELYIGGLKKIHFGKKPNDAAAECQYQKDAKNP